MVNFLSKQISIGFIHSLYKDLCNTGQSDSSDQSDDYEAYDYDDYEYEILTTTPRSTSTTSSTTTRGSSPTTPRSAGKQIPNCNGYKVLKDPKRKTSFKSSENQWRCDGDYIWKYPEWQGPGWYRFMPPAGTMITESKVEYGHCGTISAGWLKNTHPTQPGQIKNGTVCFTYGKNECTWSNTIKIKHCGTYYLYELPNVPKCHSAYCTD